LLGDRGSGRSTFIEGLLAMLGARAGRLGLREIAESRFGLPPLVGKTLVYAAILSAGLFPEAGGATTAVLKMGGSR
jgi:hypothetical protein